MGILKMVTRILNPFELVAVKSFKSTFFLFFTSFVGYFIFMEVYNNFLVTSVPGYQNKHTGSVSISLVIVLMDMSVAVIEELFYRLGLKFSPTKVVIFIFGIYFVAITFIIPYESFQNKQVFLIFLFLLIVGFLIIAYSVYIKINLFEYIWHLQYKSIFYISLLVFSVSHIQNYRVTNLFLAIICTPILLIPYIFSGYYYGILRLRFGFFWGIAAHILYNFLNRLIEVYSLF